MPLDGRQRKINIYLFGGLRLHDAVDRPLEVAGEKGSAMVACLSRCRGLCATRATLADLLWSENYGEHARNSLRQALSVLRQDLSSIDPNILRSNKESIGLSEGSIGSDAEILETAPSARSGAELEEAI